MKARAQSAGRLGRSNEQQHYPDSPTSPLSARNANSGYMERYNLGSPLSPSSADRAFGNNVLDAKISRKRAESDLQLLANRIALLKLEEQKALSKVNETKTRAQEILEVKRRNQEVLEAKLRRNEQRERELLAIQRKAAHEREERRAKLSQTKMSVIETRKSIAESRKEESRFFQNLASSGRAMTEADKRRKAEDERRRKEHIRQQKEKERMEHERRLGAMQAKKVEDEARKRKEAEDMIRLLEEEEQKLIHRLRRTQNLQQEAYSVLQRSLHT